MAGTVAVVAAVAAAALIPRISTRTRTAIRLRGGDGVGKRNPRKIRSLRVSSAGAARLLATLEVKRVEIELAREWFLSLSVASSAPGPGRAWREEEGKVGERACLLCGHTVKLIALKSPPDIYPRALSASPLVALAVVS